MASYFDEHDCKPLAENEQPNHLLHLARLLIDGGYAREWQMDFDSVFSGGNPSPPASKEWVKNLETVTATDVHEEKELKCPICLGELECGDVLKRLPCKHMYHQQCITPWLEKTNTCPSCREEYPTDDKDYEELKKQKARQKQRDFELDSLHTSMYG